MIGKCEGFSQLKNILNKLVMENKSYTEHISKFSRHKPQKFSFFLFLFHLDSTSKREETFCETLFEMC